MDTRQFGAKIAPHHFLCGLPQEGRGEASKHQCEKNTWMRKSKALAHPGKTYFLTKSTSYKRGLTSKATITCFHERVKPIGDKAQCDDAEQELTKWLTCEFLQCSIQSYSLFRIMLVRGHYQKDANDAEDHAQRSIPESTQVDHQLPHRCAQISQAEQ